MKRHIRTGAVCSLVAAGVCVAAVPAQANHPPRPGDQTRAALAAQTVETAPATCVTTAPPGSVRVPGSVFGLCDWSSRRAPTKVAAGAIRFAFSRLGARYSQSNRDSVNPPVFDCSSMVGRAFNAAGAVITHTSGYSHRLYPYFGWTGAYVPAAYAGTNLVRVSAAALAPGDIIIQFSGADPSQSYGNNGHAQIYLGNNEVIQSSTGLNVDYRHRGTFTNEWYFRFLGAGQSTPPAPVPPPYVAGTFVASDARLGVTGSPSVRSLQMALIVRRYANADLRAAGATGNYRSATQASVAYLQRSMGFSGADADGIIGPYSAAKLGLRWVVG